MLQLFVQPEVSNVNNIGIWSPQCFKLNVEVKEGMLRITAFYFMKQYIVESQRITVKIPK